MGSILSLKERRIETREDPTDQVRNIYSVLIEAKFAPTSISPYRGFLWGLCLRDLRCCLFLQRAFSGICCNSAGENSIERQRFLPYFIEPRLVEHRRDCQMRSEKVITTKTRKVLVLDNDSEGIRTLIANAAEMNDFRHMVTFDPEDFMDKLDSETTLILLELSGLPGLICTSE